jgi:hypothetical protein
MCYLLCATLVVRTNNSGVNMAYSRKPLAVALGAAFMATAVAPLASADANPFAATQLSGGYDLVNYGHHEEKANAESACGEAKCGGNMKAAGEHNCGGDKKANGEQACGGDMKAAGEHKCGGDKKAAGENNCGGDKKAGAEHNCGGE